MTEEIEIVKEEIEFDEVLGESNKWASGILSSSGDWIHCVKSGEKNGYDYYICWDYPIRPVIYRKKKEKEKEQEEEKKLVDVDYKVENGMLKATETYSDGSKREVSKFGSVDDYVRDDDIEQYTVSVGRRMAKKIDSKVLDRLEEENEDEDKHFTQTFSDDMNHNEYMKLSKELGFDWIERLTSAEYDFWAEAESLNWTELINRIVCREIKRDREKSTDKSTDNVEFPAVKTYERMKK